MTDTPLQGAPSSNPVWCRGHLHQKPSSTCPCSSLTSSLPDSLFSHTNVPTSSCVCRCRWGPCWSWQRRCGWCFHVYSAQMRNRLLLGAHWRGLTRQGVLEGHGQLPPTFVTLHICHYSNSPLSTGLVGAPGSALLFAPVARHVISSLDLTAKCHGRPVSRSAVTDCPVCLLASSPLLYRLHLLLAYIVTTTPANPLWLSSSTSHHLGQFCDPALLVFRSCCDDDVNHT